MCSPQTTDLSGSIHQFWHGILHRLWYGHLLHDGSLQQLHENTWSITVSSMGCKGISTLVLLSASSPSSPFCPWCLQGFSHFFPPHFSPLMQCFCSFLCYHRDAILAVSCSGYIVESPETAQQTLNTSHRGHPCSTPPPPCHLHTINIAKDVDCPLQAKEKVT